MILGLLGPEGTFSEKAANKWDSTAELRYFESVSDVVKAVVDEYVDYGVVPIENSLEGSIGMNLDALIEYDVKITGEVVVPIRHCLLAKGEISDIKAILSHPQALAQCRHSIKNRFGEIEMIEMMSTALAAKRASESKEMAAIASEKSAAKYGLNILLRDLQNQKENYTRFVVIGKITPEPTSKNKTSVVVYLQEDRPGALYKMLGEFASRNINLTKIESRPTKKALGDYLFYIDLEGHIMDEKVHEALKAIEREAGMLRVLGSYPKAE
ncbi:MAG: prephenate dehydratase [Methanocellales archaeon]|nr:prephenate dehydratase [Methanocellales archaeon]MDD4898456.1 prephenate dehydratase [Methanocellales archaeon]MDD5447054.1 prephenate dehydratase [Methanocellales archaeon]